MKQWLFFLLLPSLALAQKAGRQDIMRWEKQAAAVSIIRDNWGIPHIYGRSDADCVFGLMYAQAEDDFPRIEMNYLEKLGRQAEVLGEPLVYEDLINRIFLDSAQTREDYRRAPDWLKKLLTAFADGLNYYLYKNPQVQPRVLKHFEPWWPLLWTDGSIGALRTAGVSSGELKAFYSGENQGSSQAGSTEAPATGSNGFAIGPSRSASGHALLYINPHVSFYFRSEVHIISQEGLNCYGAVTWGQFFVYQGFNEHCGWMHSTSEADAEDLYIEKISRKGGQLFYAYGDKQWPLASRNYRISYSSPSGLQTAGVRVYFTGHGPIVTSRDGHWISLKARNRTMDGLIQCWQRNRAANITEFRKTLDLRGNSSNNTTYADDRGNIAYWHGNFIPVRDTSFDWSKPVDGSSLKTEWKGVHGVPDLVQVFDPPNGWIQNCNSTPFTASGAYSPRRERYPAYMAPDGENFRGVNAVRVLSADSGFTLDKLIRAGYDSYLAAFELLLPALFRAYEKESAGQSYDSLAPLINTLKNWDRRSHTESVAATLAIEWGQRLLPAIGPYYARSHADQVGAFSLFAAEAGPAILLRPLLEVKEELTKKFGSWQVPWGEINRYQRLNGDIEQQFDDQATSLPMGLVSSTWGCIPSFASRYFPPARKRYGINGNSFVCAVEFGPRVRAKSLLTGGESGHPGSRHFADQAEMYVQGKFKEVLFYREDILLHAEKTYHPGE